MGTYDITSKHLTEFRPRDWLRLLGIVLSPQSTLSLVDADLSAVQMSADKLIRIDGGGPSFLTHVEFQAGFDPRLDQRVMVYNVLAQWRHDLPVRSAVFLMRPQAWTSAITGTFREASFAPNGIDFRYELVKVWELPVELILTSGLGSLPLAPISDLGSQDLAAVIERMRRRLDAEAAPPEVQELWTATRLLMGLRFDGALVKQMLQGAMQMKESVTYQEIVEEGMFKGLAQGLVQGRLDGERRAILRQGDRRFGPADPAVLSRLHAITKLDDLDRLSLAVLTAADWADLLRSLDE